MSRTLSSSDPSGETPDHAPARPSASTARRRVRAGIFGASGTTGTELARLLAGHQAVDLLFGSSRQYAGALLSEVDPAAPHLELCHPTQVDPASLELAFLCLPHGSSAETAGRCLEAGARVIDLSGDLRLRDPALHRATYGTPRPPEVAEQAVYGLTELSREAVCTARVVANPGCYPTCVGLALLPLAEAGALRGPLVVSAVSGVSGAGRGATATTHFCSVTADVRPYKVGRVHRHVPEMEQTLAGVHPRGHWPTVVFTPQLVPLERGMLATCTVQTPGVSAAEARGLLVERYRHEPFVQVLPEGKTSRIRGAAGTNRAVLSLHEVEGSEALVLISAIDNLGKGAAGQAIQNMNVMLDLPETTGLPGARGRGLDTPSLAAPPR